MKINLPNQRYILFLTAFVLILGTISPTYSQIFKSKRESSVTFPKVINPPEVDFDLKSTGFKKFEVKLDKKPASATQVKVYDFLGNLILEDKIRPEDGQHKTFDLSTTNSEIFVVEIGNSKYNKTKSIYASPPGKKQKVSSGSDGE